MTYPCKVAREVIPHPADGYLHGQCSAELGPNVRCEHRVEVILQVVSRVSETDPGTALVHIPICACTPCCAAALETLRRILERGRRDYATSQPAR